MSKILCWEGGTMWDSRAVQVFPCKDTVCQQGLCVLCCTHGSSALHLSCEKLTGTWELCMWPRCSLGCAVCGQTQAHFPGTARVCRAGLAQRGGRADTGSRVGMAFSSQLEAEFPKKIHTSTGDLLLQRWSLYSLFFFSDMMVYAFPSVIAEEIIISNKFSICCSSMLLNPRTISVQVSKWLFTTCVCQFLQASFSQLVSHLFMWLIFKPFVILGSSSI